MRKSEFSESQIVGTLKAAVAALLGVPITLPGPQRQTRAV